MTRDQENTTDSNSPSRNLEVVRPNILVKAIEALGLFLNESDIVDRARQFDSDRTVKFGQSLSSIPKIKSLLKRRSNDDNVFDISIGRPIGSRIANTELTDRLFLTPRNLKWPCGKSILSASSRIGKDLDAKPEFFDALRTLAIRTSADENYFVSSPRLTTHRFVRRLCGLFGITCLNFEPLPNRCESLDPQNIYFSAPLEQQIGEAPSPDRLLMEFADEVVVLSARRNGIVHRGILDRIQTGKPTRLLISDSLTPRKLKDELVDSGATAWWLYDEPQDEPIATKTTRRSSPRILTVDEIDEEQFLVHWTRRRKGPSPVQTENEYLDELIFGNVSPNSPEINSDLASLCRILISQKIYATSQLTRCSQPVVCLSGAKLSELSGASQFQKHLARWDRLPFGVAIDRDVARSLGARPVIYGDEQTWAGLAESDKPFFQSRGNDDRWMDENETRILFDLDLRNFAFDQAIVFVSSNTHAEIVAPLSIWPIVVLNP